MDETMNVMNNEVVAEAFAEAGEACLEKVSKHGITAGVLLGLGMIAVPTVAYVGYKYVLKPMMDKRKAAKVINVEVVTPADEDVKSDE